VEKMDSGEVIQGIVERVTFHNESNGWSVLKVKCYNDFEATTVIVHQTKVFAGATMKFFGSWSTHPRFGRQFTATRSLEQKPASAAALEKYIGSGLIKGVGSKTAKRIVNHFGKNTLSVFENSIEDLLQVPTIANKKLKTIQEAWQEHKAISEVMMFLQSHGISTLFAVRIFKKYGQDAIKIVNENPYRLANDFYGIGFFSADKVALSIGIKEDAPVRVFAGIRHVLAAAREQGHCYLQYEQIGRGIKELLTMDLLPVLAEYLLQMEEQNLLRKRFIGKTGSTGQFCYYAKSLYYDEQISGDRIKILNRRIDVDSKRVRKWINSFNKRQSFSLSAEQQNAVEEIVTHGCAVLTGGPGCGKTTTTKTLVKLFLAMGKKVLLTAPTGRAAQRMEEVIGIEAKTIHRLLEFQNGSFRKNREFPLVTDVLVVDECSMLDISLSSALFSAVSDSSQLILIGDSDQLPSVGAGNVLGDIINSRQIPVYHLQEVFRQAQQSKIISFAHNINNGVVPKIPSPFKEPSLWNQRCDCLFIDSNEATQEQLRIIKQVKVRIEAVRIEQEYGMDNLFCPSDENGNEPAKQILRDKYKHIDFGLLQTAETDADKLLAVLKKVHPWSSLYYGLTAGQVIVRLYSDWIPKYFGTQTEIQLLSPMTRGSLGTAKLNTCLQDTANKETKDKPQITLGERVFRVGDRVLHRKNNYDLGVYNGDIGTITSVNAVDITCTVQFHSDQRFVDYERDQISELDLAYAITIHKSQGSEFDCVIIPLVSQHFKMLFRNLIYTGLTRAKKLAVFVGTRQALAMATHNVNTARRQTALAQLLMEKPGDV